MKDLEQTFNQYFNCKPLSELPSIPKQYSYFPDNKMNGQDGLIIEVEPQNGLPWIGIFSFGDFENGKTGIFSHPDPNSVCVISKGRGYIVKANNPSQWMEISAYPIFDAISIRKHNSLIIATNSGLIAYDDKGLKWKTDRLTLDDLKICGLTEDAVTVEGSGLRKESVKFKIEFELGRVFQLS